METPMLHTHIHTQLQQNITQNKLKLQYQPSTHVQSMGIEARGGTQGANTAPWIPGHHLLEKFYRISPKECSAQ